MTTLAHKDRTVQDIIDEMSPDERELMDLIIGACVEDEVIDDDDVIAQADALSQEQKQVIDYIVGGILSQEADNELAQANLRVNNFLEHFGVKGMKWGVRNVDRPAGAGGSSKSQSKPPKLVGNAGTVKLSGSTSNTADERKAARKAVRKGTATATQTHVAALKSTGHRVANAFLGDKSYWKGVALTVGIAGAVALSPAVLPAEVLGVIGGALTPDVSGTSGAVVTGSIILTGSAYIGASIANTVLQVKNVVRAVAGNSRVDDSYARLGSNATANYKKGMDRTAKVLRKNGGLSGRKVDKALKQSDDLRVNNFLEHYSGMSLVQLKSGV